MSQSFFPGCVLYLHPSYSRDSLDQFVLRLLSNCFVYHAFKHTVFPSCLLTLLFFSFNLPRFFLLHLPSLLYPNITTALLHGVLSPGVSDGIGLAIARELTKHNFNIVLHGHNPTNIEDIKHCLNQDFPKIHSRIAISDASASNPNTTIQNVIEIVKDRQLTILVNNIGGSDAVVRTRHQNFSKTTTTEEMKSKTSPKSEFTIPNSNHAHLTSHPIENQRTYPKRLSLSRNSFAAGGRALRRRQGIHAELE